MRRIAVVSCLMLAACSADGLPDPISPQPMPVPGRVITLDVSLIDAEITTSGFVLRGRADAVTGDATVAILDLGSEERVEVVAEADGSFEASVSGMPNDVLLLGARLMGFAADEKYVRVPTSPGQVEDVSESCMASSVREAVRLAAVVDERACGAVAVTNSCGTGFDLSQVRRLSNDPAFSLVVPEERQVLPGRELMVPIRFEPAREGQFEDVLILDFEGGDLPSLAAFVWGEGTAPVEGLEGGSNPGCL